MKVLLHAILVICFCWFADFLLTTKPFGSDVFWGLYDGGIHGLIGLFVLLPFARKDHLLNDAFIFLCIGALIDIDHFIYVKSFSVKEVIALPFRPITHSFTFILLLCTIIYFFSKKWAVIICIGLSSHIVRDASSGVTPIFYPLELYWIPYWLYLSTMFILVLISYKLRNQFRFKDTKFIL